MKFTCKASLIYLITDNGLMNIRIRLNFLICSNNNREFFYILLILIRFLRPNRLMRFYSLKLRLIIGLKMMRNGSFFVFSFS